MQISLNKMSTEEKLKLMEILWNDLIKDEKNVPTPSWHKEELLQREKHFKNGKEEIIDWEDAKKDIKKSL